MVALRCIALQNDPDVEDKKVCRAYYKGDSFHVVGGIMTESWLKQNRIQEVKCSRCKRFGQDIFTAGSIPV